MYVGSLLLWAYDEWVADKVLTESKPEPEPEPESLYRYPARIELMIKDIDVPIEKMIYAVEHWVDPKPMDITSHLDWIGNLEYFEENGVLPQDYYRTINDPRRL